MAVSKKAKAIYMGFFDGIETFAANTISNIQERRLLKKYAPKEPIPKDYAKAYKAYWKQFGINANPMWGWYYAARNGNMDVRYVPNTLYFTKIDQHFNSRKLGYGFNDKNYYSLLFPDVLQPKTYIRKIGCLLFDENYRLLSVDDATKLVECLPEVIIKPTQETGSGRGITFLKPKEQRNKLIEFLNNKEEHDCIVQSIVQQHTFLANIYPKALNTIRVTTLLLEDGVHILSAVLRTGSGSSRVDNASNGGVPVGINPDGTLKEYGYVLYEGKATKQHPQGFIFNGQSIPSFEKILLIVKELAQRTGNFRLVSWDMTIDSNEEVVLIEANMRKGGIAIHQFNNGPIFGELTDKVIEEVINKRR